jgi:oxygen-independent coproporphyrinogen-3 oxidase
MKLTPELIKRFDIEAPRYTSYPTAPIWNADYTTAHYKQRLQRLNQQNTPLSLYIHVPFCTKRCYYCACNVVIRKPNETVGDEYLNYLSKELDLITQDLGTQHPLEQLHIGGGTPTFLSDQQLSELMAMLKRYFNLSTLGECAIEVDPRSVDPSRIEHLYQLGFNRLSFGIQDFDPDVQDYIGRHQSVEDVTVIFQAARKAGFQSINCDLIYGLPGQTMASFNETLKHISALGPDRIALYSFAYVPWLYSHQSIMPEDAFPDTEEKLSIFTSARDYFLENGYTAIAMDHFAKETDGLSIAYNNGTMTRNFMGYTTLATEDYLGIGVSAIGYVAESFTQNTKDLNAYMASLDKNQLPLEKGLELTQDDVMRRWIITTLMCQFVLQKDDVEYRFNVDFDIVFDKELEALKNCVDDGLVVLDDTQITVTELGKLFVRNIVRHFDAYLKANKKPQQFSRTV